MKRHKIKLESTVQELVVTMSEGNPGALVVLIQIINKDLGKYLHYILLLDSMNIRGPQIWVGYKEYCLADIEKFKKAIIAKDLKMISTINRSMGADYPHLATFLGREDDRGAYGTWCDALLGRNSAR